jgi:transcriptional regulator with XRE-family HTH domain
VSADRPEDGAVVAELGRRVRLHRLYRDLTQEQLGERAGLSRNFVSLFEQGRHGIKVAAVRRLAWALAVPLPTLVAEPGDGVLPSGSIAGRSDPMTTADVGMRVRLLRTVRRMSQDRLADVACVSPGDARRDRATRARRRSPPVRRSRGGAGRPAEVTVRRQPRPGHARPRSAPQTQQ